MIIYLSGPMKGYPEHNFPAFVDAAGILRMNGHTVYNPSEYSAQGANFDIRKAFVAYCTFICLEADTIVLLPGWENSSGANVELALAKICGLRVLEWANYKEWKDAP